ncbi:hypothetical protein LIA77_07546 [Sarocladium implicatum]|nr:hypothetical protein LIA77_07546 [Sarocladium implicatum]
MHAQCEGRALPVTRVLRRDAVTGPSMLPQHGAMCTARIQAGKPRQMKPPKSHQASFNCHSLARRYHARGKCTVVRNEFAPAGNPRSRPISRCTDKLSMMLGTTGLS